MYIYICIKTRVYIYTCFSSLCLAFRASDFHFLLFHNETNDSIVMKCKNFETEIPKKTMMMLPDGSIRDARQFSAKRRRSINAAELFSRVHTASCLAVFAIPLAEDSAVVASINKQSPPSSSARRAT